MDLLELELTLVVLGLKPSTLDTQNSTESTTIVGKFSIKNSVCGTQL